MMGRGGIKWKSGNTAQTTCGGAAGWLLAVVAGGAVAVAVAVVAVLPPAP